MLTPITKQTKAIAKLANADNMDTERGKVLGSLVFEPDGSIVACNQYRFLIAKDVDFNQPSPTRSLIPAQAILDAELPKGQKLQVASIDETIGEYPDYKLIIPNLNDENSLTFNVNARFLSELVDAMQKILNNKDATLSITVHNTERRKPIKIESKTLTGYVMPISR